VLKGRHRNQSSGKTHCPRGHELKDGNLVRAEVLRGWRACLTCSRDKAKERRLLSRQA
jgi:hypothetical protein